jgi:Ca-activated chloride channel family protein
MPVLDPQGERIGTRQIMSDLDEPLLREIAGRTGGRYFRVADTGAVEQAFAEIDRARKIEFATRSHVTTEELFGPYALAGLVLLALASAGAARQAHQEVVA